ncbi:MAG: hypothetical protein IKI15_07600 [Lachnospiraceae bacterium]|nr:hypothetical protein [Lachnospiraceae bacterium]
MHKKLSVLALMLRVKMKWVLVSVACMIVLSLGAYTVLVRTNSFRLGKSYILFLGIFSVASFFTALACTGILSARSTRRYLLTRLQISERNVFLWEIVACSLFFLLLWQAEIITLGLAGLIQSSFEWHEGGPQDIVFAMYGNKFYKSIVPMSSVTGWLHGIVCVICGGVSCACVSMHTGKSASFGTGIATMVFTSIMFVSGWELESVFFVGLGLLITVVLTVKQLHDGKERTEDEVADC